MMRPLQRIALERFEVFLGRPFTEVEKIRLEILDARITLLEMAVDGARKANKAQLPNRAAKCIAVARETWDQLMRGDL
jgi:hypothetical protein